MKKGRFEQSSQKKGHGKLVLIFLVILIVVGIVVVAIRFLPKGLNRDAENASEGTIAETLGADVYVPTNTEIRYEFIDHTTFSDYLTNGVFKCGSDFEPGDYYIMSIYMAEAMFDVSNDPNGFTWTDYRMMRKISVDNGQYVNLPTGAIMVNVTEVDENDWGKYGVFLVGKDLPEGEYKVVSISDEYCSDLNNIAGIFGAYQICDNDPTSEPVACSPLFNNQTYISLKNGQYIIINNAHLTLDGAETEETVCIPQLTPVEEAYLTATTLTKAGLMGEKGKWEYKGIPLLREDAEWVDTSWNTNGTVNQGAIYRKMAHLLEGFDLRVNDYKTYAEILLGFVPDSREDFEPYAENARSFIVISHPLKPIMQAFEKLDCVEGTFDYERNTLGVYDFIISDTRKCAGGMQISEEMLGYTLAMLSEFGATITFDGNTCHVGYISLEGETPEPITESDFVVELPSVGTTEDMLNYIQSLGNGGFQFFYFDATYDESKESVIKTSRDVVIGQSKDEVIEAYGEGDIKKFRTDDNQLYAGLAAMNPEHAAVMRTQCSTYITYTYSDIADIEFYFDEYDVLTWVVFMVK